MHDSINFLLWSLQIQTTLI